MKFAIEKDELQKEILIAQKVITEKSALSATASVFIEAREEGSLLIRATDLNVSFETAIPADVEEAGSALVFCEKLRGALLALPAGEIEFACGEAGATLRPKERKALFKFKTLSAGSFPEIPSSEGVEFFSLPSRALKRMIAHTVFAASNDRLRYFLNGVYAEKDGDCLKFVATDGRRLALIQAEIEGGFPDFASSIIPAPALDMVGKRCADEGAASVGFSEKYAFFKIGGREFSIRLIDGQFPNYKRVIPQSQSRHLSIGRKDFGEALRRVGVLAEAKSGKVRLEMSGNVLKISAQDAELGDADEFVDCDYRDDAFATAANCAYLKEPVETIECDEVRLGFSDPMRALTLEGAGDGSFLHVVMPMLMD